MLQEFIRAFCLVFIAEIGDKSQILAMSFAAKYKTTYVIAGMLVGVIFNHCIAIVVGVYISNIIPIKIIQIMAGILFIIFGFFTFRSDKNVESSSNNFNVGITVTIATAFFLGELGDKTQLTALTLAMEGKWPLIILTGTTVAMLCVASIGIFIVKRLNKRIPTYIIRITSGSVFIFLGMTKVFTTSNLFVNNKMLMAAFIITVVLLSLLMASKLLEETK